MPPKFGLYSLTEENNDTIFYEKMGVYFFEVDLFCSCPTYLRAYQLNAPTRKEP